MKGIDFLNSLAKWDNKSKFGLDNIKKVLFYLNNPQDRPKSIHIGGTNGKGTTSVAIASILGAAGYNVGLNTSPHLVRLNERFIINGVEASDQQISDSALKVQGAINYTNTSLSYHEAITATAFVLFQDLDWIVIEVGLGGRLDASNVLEKPNAVIITSISLDHELILGDTIGKISKEKAGIIKDSTILVLGELPDDANNVIKDVVADKSQTNVFQFTKNFSYKKLEQGIEFQSPMMTFPLSTYQYKNHTKAINDCLAIETCLLLGLNRYIEQGINNYYWPGRYETIVYQDNKFIVDAAHNPASIDALVEYLQINYPDKTDFQIIFAALDSKNWKYFIDQLKTYIVHWHIVLADSDVAVKTNQIGDYLSGLGINNYQEYGLDYSTAILNACQSPLNETIVAGSMYMIGGVKQLLHDLPKDYWKKITH